MFNLTIVDHVRLSFGHVVQNYSVHARAADRIGTVALYSRVGVLALLAIGSAASVAVLLDAGRGVQMTAAIATGLALIWQAAVASLGIDDRLAGHRYRANRLWLLCERYRALLAEIQDGLLERDAILGRRDALIQQFNDIHEQGPPATTPAARAAAQAGAARRVLSDEQIDQFLPASLRKSSGPAKNA